MINVFRARIGMEAANSEREALKQQRDHWQQISFADMFHRCDQFPLGDDIHGVDVVDPLQPIPMALGQPLALMYRIDADITGHTLWRRRFADADGHWCRSRVVPYQALFPVRFTAAQVVQVRD